MAGGQVCAWPKKTRFMKSAACDDLEGKSGKGKGDGSHLLTGPGVLG
jgi:hypothetical protein